MEVIYHLDINEFIGAYNMEYANTRYSAPDLVIMSLFAFYSIETTNIHVNLQSCKHVESWSKESSEDKIIEMHIKTLIHESLHCVLMKAGIDPKYHHNIIEDKLGM